MVNPLSLEVPSMRTVAMPADANANGDIFGGWLMSQMDLAGGVMHTKRRVGVLRRLRLMQCLFTCRSKLEIW